MRNSNKKDENKKFKNKIVKFFLIYCILYLDYVMNNVCGTFSSMYI